MFKQLSYIMHVNQKNETEKQHKIISLMGYECIVDRWNLKKIKFFNRKPCPYLIPTIEAAAQEINQAMPAMSINYHSCRHSSSYFNIID